MAKSDSDSNGLRQDQPECSLQSREVRRDHVHCYPWTWSLSKCVRRHSSTECHRTTKANIRSHLYGGPQGWNPHFFGPERCSESRIRASEYVRRISTRRLVLSAAGTPPRPDFVRVISECPITLKGTGVRLVPNRGTGTTFASNSSALLHLRASNRFPPRASRRESV